MEGVIEMAIFEQDQVEVVYAREALLEPREVLVDGDDVAVGAWAGGDGVVALVRRQGGLSGEAADELAVTLAGVIAAYPSEVGGDVDDRVDVPLWEPRMAGSEAIWRVGDRVTLIHAGWRELYLWIETPPDARGERRVVLDGAECWELVRALVSLGVWRERLVEAFAAAADACRRQGVGWSGSSEDLPATFAGEAGKALTLGKARLVPCDVRLQDRSVAVERSAGREWDVRVELGREVWGPDRSLLASILVSIRGVPLPAWITRGVAEVPYLEPVGGDGGRFSWRITRDLWLEDEEGLVYLTDASDDRHLPVVTATLNVEETRRLLRALVSVDGWHQERDAYASAAIQTRWLERLDQLRRRRRGSAVSGGDAATATAG